MSTKRLVLYALVFALAGIVLVWFVVGSTLPETFDVESQRDLRAPSARVAAVVTDLKSWNDWSAMDANLGPQTTREVVGVAGTVGQAMRWTGQKGTAVLRFRAVGDNGVEYEFRGQLADGRDYPWRGDGRIEWQQDGDVCKVRWQEHLTWETMAGRWVAWFGAQQENVRRIQTSSLQGLAEAVEAAVK
ncbi:MAG: SRPBCC family protein [Planctomycetes bacterium]|nr:SRPBCC family protein [Planctomycetota bacterium]